MKYLGILCFVIYSSFALAADPQPIENLESYFIDHGIDYTKYPNHIGYSGENDPSRYVFLDYDDPADNETVGLFFEFQIVNFKLGSNTHLAAGLRGQLEELLEQEVVTGRGVGIGALGVYEGCTLESRGFFIENWAASELYGIEGPYPEGYYPDEPIQATPCQEIDMPPYAIYRVDLHVSLWNTYVAIWEKKHSGWPFFKPTYTFLGDSSCLRDTNDWCKELVVEEELGLDNEVGNGFITLYSSEAGIRYYLRNIFIAKWD